MITIRRANPDDVAGVWRLHASSVLTLCATHYSTEQIEAWIALIHESYRDIDAIALTSRIMFVAELDGGIVGFSVLVENTIEAVYVDPAYAKRGIGQRLLAELEKEASSRKVDVLRLDSSLNAIRFYEHCGYRIVEYGSHRLMNSDVHIPCALMQKSLGSTGPQVASM